ncbi:hypothetical protein GOB57_21175 [Sinorhizobium meliloti]|nr:hypothetical protein [Sinorhizobium meliloti]
MIIELPFSYKISGVEPRKRNTTERTGMDTALVNVRDVQEADCPVALTVLDEFGSHSETFRHFDGSFWIKDSRIDDLDFCKQHIMLMGEWPKKKQLSPSYHQNQRHFKPYRQEDADSDNAKACKGLSLIGILRYRLTECHSVFSIVDQDLQPKPPFYQTDAGGVSCAIVDPADTYRVIVRSSINEQRQKAVEYAQSNVIAIDGVLWHRSPVPAIYATDKDIVWGFDGSIGRELTANRYAYASSMHDRDDISIASAYKMSMTEYDTIPDAFPDAIEKERVKFYIEYIDASFFEKPDIRPLIIKDIKAAMSKIGVLEESTPYVYKWLELRDLIAARGKKVEEQDDDFLDAAADILLELDAMLGKTRYPGAVMWANRQVDLSFPEAPDTRSTPAY